MSHRVFVSLIFSFYCLVFSGCSEKVDPKILAIRQSIQAEQSPGKSESVKIAREAAEKGDEFIITGKVGVKDLNQWWVDGQAAFWITEASQDEANHGGPNHDPASCPFCSRKYKETVAVIQPVDENGNLVSVDAKTLFNLQAGDLVTVKGKGEIDESGILNVKTSRIYIHPKK